MAKAVSCACGWHTQGTKEDLVDAAFARHIEEEHGKETSVEQSASQIEEGCGC